MTMAASVTIPSYRILGDAPIGQGAMADVWLAEHRITGRRAAIKVLRASAMSDEDVEQLFVREARVLASIDHRHVVRIYEVERSADLAYLVMEYLGGGTLERRLQTAPASAADAIGFTTQLASGLAAAHALGVIHRDLKPANVLLRDEFNAVLTDFGAARLLGHGTIYGRDGGIVGTPRYMSPEQIKGETLGAPSDIYALGVVLYELLTGRPPYDGGSFEQVLGQHLFAPLPVLPMRYQMLQPLLARMMAKQPESRFGSAEALLEVLREILAQDAVLRTQVREADTTQVWSGYFRTLGISSGQSVLPFPSPGSLPADVPALAREPTANPGAMAEHSHELPRIAKAPQKRLPWALVALAVALVSAGAITYLWAVAGNTDAVDASASQAAPETILAAPPAASNVQDKKSSAPARSLRADIVLPSAEFDAKASPVAVQFIDAQHIWLISRHEREDFSSMHKVYNSNDGGQAWSKRLESETWISALQFLDARTGWIARSGRGKPSVLMTTRDGGASWNAQGELPPRNGVTGDFYAIWFTDPRYGWAGGSGATILNTIDAGKTWHRQPNPMSETYPENVNGALRVQFPTPQRGWALVGPALLATERSGDLWQAKYLAQKGENMADIHLLESGTGWIAGQQFLLRSDDFGATWLRAGVPERFNYLFDISFQDEQRGWLIADHKLYFSNDGGLSWRHLPAEGEMFRFTQHGPLWAFGKTGLFRLDARLHEEMTAGVPFQPTLQTGRPVPKVAKARLLDWQSTPEAVCDFKGMTMDVDCPPGGVLRDVRGGGGEYLCESSICSAAVHAGRINVQEGGTVKLRMLGITGKAWTAETRNGVTPLETIFVAGRNPEPVFSVQ